MKRRLFNVAALLSLLLCVAAAALCVRGQRTRDVAIFGSGSRSARTQWHLSSAGGEVRVMRVRGPVAFARRGGGRWWSEPVGDRRWSWLHADSAWGVLGISVHSGESGRDAVVGNTTYFRTSYRAVIVPLWMPAVLFALPSGVWIVKWWRRPRLALACASCGYDLRGTSGNTCPECGVQRAVGAR